MIIINDHHYVQKTSIFVPTGNWVSKHVFRTKKFKFDVSWDSFAWNFELRHSFFEAEVMRWVWKPPGNGFWRFQFFIKTSWQRHIFRKNDFSIKNWFSTGGSSGHIDRCKMTAPTWRTFDKKSVRNTTLVQDHIFLLQDHIFLRNDDFPENIDFRPNQELGLQTGFSNEKFQIWRLLRQFCVKI